MSKLKILLTTLCFTLMSICFCFADDIDNRALGIDDKKYYVSYESSKGYTAVYTFNSGSRDTSTSYVIKDYNFYKFYSDDNYKLDSSGKSIHFTSGDYGTIYTNSKDLYNNMLSWGYISSDSIYDDGSLVRPPLIAPTIQGAIQGILPTFSSQLSVFLPKALIIFSMVLLVPLVPRVIRFFF